MIEDFHHLFLSQANTQNHWLSNIQNRIFDLLHQNDKHVGMPKNPSQQYLSHNTPLDNQHMDLLIHPSHKTLIQWHLLPSTNMATGPLLEQPIQPC